MPADGPLRRSEGAGFTIEGDHQLAVFDGACNECSNCEVYCPEVGAPYRVKERVFASLELLEESGREGFHRVGTVLTARLGDRLHRMEVNEGENRARLSVGCGTFLLQWEPLRVLDREKEPEPGGEWKDTAQPDDLDGGPGFDTAALWRMKTVWEDIFFSGRPNPVNPRGG
jgi:hypothetical protein